MMPVVWGWGLRITRCLGRRCRSRVGRGGCSRVGWLDTHPWLADHAVLDTVLSPGTGFLELVLAAGRGVGCEVVEELALEGPLVFERGGAVQLQVAVGEPDGDGRREVSVYSRGQAQAGDGSGDEAGGWTRHASGALTETGMLAGGERPASVADMGTVAPGVQSLGSEWPPAGSEELMSSFCMTGWRRPGSAMARCSRVSVRRGAGMGRSSRRWPSAKRLPRRPAGSVFTPRYWMRHCMGLYLLGEVDGPDPGGVMLPFSLGGVSLRREGVSSLQVCLTRGEGARWPRPRSTRRGARAVDRLARVPAAAGGPVGWRPRSGWLPARRTRGSSCPCPPSPQPSPAWRCSAIVRRRCGHRAVAGVMRI